MTIFVRSNKIPPCPTRPSPPARRPDCARLPAPCGRDGAADRILAAALEAFAERGFDGATTREIAAAAHVPQGLVAYHFASKQALWEAAVDRVFREARAELGGVVGALRDEAPATRLRAVMRRFVRFSAAHPEFHRFMVHEGAHDGPRLRWLVEHHVRPLYEATVALMREAAPELDAPHWYYLVLGAATHLFAVAPEFERLAGRDPRTPEMVEAQAAAVTELLIDAALARPASLLARPAPTTKRARTQRTQKEESS